MGLINIAVSSCSAAQAKITFAAFFSERFKSKGLWQKQGQNCVMNWDGEICRSATPVEPEGLKAASPPARAELLLSLTCLPIAFLKQQPPCLARALMWAMSVERLGRFHFCKPCVALRDHPLHFSMDLASIYEKKLLLLVSLTSVVSQLQEQT